MENLNLNLISLIVAIVVGFLTAISLTLTIIKKVALSHKRTLSARLEKAEDEAEKAKLEEEVKETSALVSGLKSINDLVAHVIPTAIKTAEESGLITGESKLTLALSKIALWCTSNGYDFEEHEDFIRDEIEKQLTFTKEVNKRDKDGVSHAEIH